VLERITPLVLTYDEAPNIRRSLEGLAWAKRVVVLDSGSTDGTQAIVAEYPNAVVFTRPFDTLACQWNFGLRETGIDTEWVLALDADYGITPAFVEMLRRLEPPSAVGGYRARFRYCIDGEPLVGALYPPVTVLYRRRGARYSQEGHTQRVGVEGEVAPLAVPLLHDDRKPLERWFRSQIRYMREEAEHLCALSPAELRLPDRIRRFIVVAPVLVFFSCLVVRGNLLDGRRGLFYALQRTAAEAILAAMIVEARLRRREGAA